MSSAEPSACGFCGDPMARGRRRPPKGCGKSKCRGQRRRNRLRIFAQVRARGLGRDVQLLIAVRRSFGLRGFSAEEARAAALEEGLDVEVGEAERVLRELALDTNAIRVERRSVEGSRREIFASAPRR